MVALKVGNVSGNHLEEGHGTRSLRTDVPSISPRGFHCRRLTIVTFTFTLQFIARIHPDLNAGPPPPLNPESVLSSPPPPTIKDLKSCRGWSVFSARHTDKKCESLWFWQVSR